MSISVCTAGREKAIIKTMMKINVRYVKYRVWEKTNKQRMQTGEHPTSFSSTAVVDLIFLSAQTYVGRKRAAVGQICVGVPAGEVKSLSSLH